MTEHSALPWQYVPMVNMEDKVYYWIQGSNADVCALDSEVNAKLIVKAVNSHQILVDAFNPRTWSKEMSDAWHKNIPDTQKAFQVLFKAILKEIGEG